MEFSIKEYNEYKEEEILNLYTSVGWTNYTENPTMLKNAFQNSLKIYAAYEKDRLLGIIRAVGDGHSILFIQDILILPEYQRLGIGTALMNRMLDEYKHVYQKSLMTDNTEKTIQFYRSCGFTKLSDINCCAFQKIF